MKGEKEKETKGNFLIFLRVNSNFDMWHKDSKSHGEFPKRTWSP